MRTKSIITLLLLAILAVALLGCSETAETPVAAGAGNGNGPAANGGDGTAGVETAPAAPGDSAQNGAVSGNMNRGGNAGNGAMNGPGAANANRAGAGVHTGILTDTLSASGELSPAAAAALRFMREEEKMARDLYTAFHETWGLPVFQNIAASEQAHMDATLSFLNAYELADPAAGNGPGEFSNPELQALYDELSAQGAASLADALMAAAAVEEIDILDLEARMANLDNAQVVQMFRHLRNGSENHLRAFVNNYERQAGAAYRPQYLTQARYETMMMAMGSGGAGAQNGRGQGDQGQGRSGNGNGYRGGRGN
jgi:hypothetical protein